MAHRAIRAAMALACLALPYLATPVAHAATFTVSTTADSGIGSLRQAILDANATPGADQINLPQAVYLIDSPLPVITEGVLVVGLPSGLPTIIDGRGQHRIFFVGDGTAAVVLVLQNLTLANGRAQGGAGGSGGGGGMGAGGAVFVNTNGYLVLNNVTFTDNVAAGGAGGQALGSRAGGGGGLGGSGGLGTVMGGGGGGFDAAARGSQANAANEPGSAGQFPGAAAGNGAGGAAGGPGGGGGGGGSGTEPHGGGGGVGAAPGAGDLLAGSGGAGGDFGGGGGSLLIGGAGGFGGGGGSGTLDRGAAGGFGGGGGYPGGTGGVGGGNATGSGGGSGGGAGLGGAIFVRDGGSVDFSVVDETGSAVTPGAAGGPGTPGSAFGAGVFMQGSGGTIRMRANVASWVVDLGSALADEAGATGVGAMPRRLVSVEGLGRVTMRGDNRYAGDTEITGNLEIAGSTISRLLVRAGGRVGGDGVIQGDLDSVEGILDAAMDRDVPATLDVTGDVNVVSSGEYRTRLFADGTAAHVRSGNTAIIISVPLTVQLEAGYVHAPGNVFTILEYAARVGEFAGRPEGTVFAIGGHRFRISYATAGRVTLAAITEPSPPLGVGYVAGLGEATISYAPPATDGGFPVTGYTVDCGGGITVTDTASPTVVTGLVAGTTYACTVTATNAIGTSAPSAPISVSPFNVPGAPTAVTYTAGLGEVSIAFSPPASDGGTPITGYTADCGPGLVVNGSSPIVVTGLTPGATYACNVTATNAVGPGAAATLSVSAFNVPGAPGGVAAAPGHRQAVVSFTAPADNGGTAILDYTATCGTFAATSAASPITITGLTNGTTYSCTVRARNAVGPGPASAAASVTPRTLPDAPTGVTATRGNAQATVSFTAPADNGSPITSYTATCGTQSATGPASPLVVTGLTNGTTYNCSVRATNAAGEGPPSASASVTPATTPGAPQSVTLTPGNGQLTVSFGAPADDGGLAITSYTATCGTQSMSGPASPLVVTGLANGVAVSCTVTATNAVGTGPASAAQSGMPSLKTFSGPTATGSGTATAVLTGGGASCNFATAAFIAPPPGAPPVPPTAPPGNVSFPHGLFDFTLSGCTPGSTVTIEVTYPGPVQGLVYWKYGPTPDDAAPHWYVMPATLGGNVATFSITDGGLGDDDLAANGAIVDQGGPGLGMGAAAIPTMSEWMMMLMALLMLGSAGIALRRR